MNKIQTYNHQYRHTLNGHTDGVNTAGFSPDGRQIVTASSDGSVKMWAIYPSIGEKVAVARARLVNGFSDEECRRFYRDDLDSCPQTLDQLFALFEGDL